MSFITKLDRARTVLKQQNRLSVRALGRELELSGEDLDEIVEELVDIQRVARLDGKALVWAGDSPDEEPSPQPSPRGRGSEDGQTTESPRSLGKAASQGHVRDYTPKHLADKILASRSAMEGEKKQVTVLFCDVVDSMDLAEALGPEGWHGILNEFFEVLTSAIHEFEGTVNQYTGDGVMALFGAPIAAEDHARRACMAALAIQEKLAALRSMIKQDLGKQFAVRIGINSGEVVVGRIGDDLRMDYTAQGHVVGIAARLEAKALPDAVLISPSSKTLVEGYFELESIGSQTIKGVSTPLEVFRLGEAKQDITRLDIARQRGFSKFVGRDVEMAVLKQALKRAQSGQGQVLGISAPAGAGKSRLCWEFIQFCKTQSDVLLVPVSHQQHQRNVPYAGYDQLMAALYGYAENDSPAQKRLKIRNLQLGWNPDKESGLLMSYEFAGVSNVDNPPPSISPEEKRRWVMKGLSWSLQQLTENQTLVYIVEDLQWSDPASMVILEFIVQLAARGRGLVVWNARPEFEPGWPTNLPHMQNLYLHPLDTDALGVLLRTTLGDDPSLKGLADAILKASAGNPFYVEEIVRSLVEGNELQGQQGNYRLKRPVTELPLPDSIHSLLAARIDNLNEQDKCLLQSVSVLGREFDRPDAQLLTELPDADLNQCFSRLERAEFIYPIAKDHYQFKHGLTLDVANASLLQSKRQVLHRQVAESLSQQTDLADSKLTELAHHWEQAGDLLNAALSMHLAAKASFKRDLHESLRLRREYLRLERAQPANPALVKPGLSARRALIEWSQHDVMSAAEVRQLYDEGSVMATANKDPVAFASILGGYALRLGAEGRLTQACELADRLLALVENTPDTLGKAVALGVVGGMVYSMTGWVHKGIQATEQAQSILAAHPELVSGEVLNICSYTICSRAALLGASGQVQASVDMLNQLVAGENGNNDRVIQYAGGGINVITIFAGIVDDVEGRNARITGRLDANSGPWCQSIDYFHRGTGHTQLENWLEAEGDFETAISIAKSNEGCTQARHLSDCHLPYVKLRLGKVNEALTLVAKSLVDSAASGGDWFHSGSAWTACRVWREARQAEAIADIEALLPEWKKTIDVSGMELFRHLWWWEAARLAHMKGDVTGYRAGLEKALASAIECEAIGHADEIRQELAA